MSREARQDGPAAKEGRISPVHCPYCGGRAISGSRFERSRAWDVATQSIRCADCDGSYRIDFRPLRLRLQADHGRGEPDGRKVDLSPDRFDRWLEESGRWTARAVIGWRRNVPWSVRWMLALLVVLGPLCCVLIEWRVVDDDVFVFPLVALMATQAGLLGWWACSGARIGFWRLAGLVLGGVCLAGLYGGMIDDDVFLPVLAAVAGAGATFAAMSWRGVRTAFAPAEKSSDGAKLFQFSILDLMLVTLATGFTFAVVHLGQRWLDAGRDGETIAGMLFAALAESWLVLLSAWAVLGTGRIWPRVTVCTIVAACQGLLLAHVFDPGDVETYLLLSFLSLLTAGMMMGSFAVLRRWGYRYLKVPRPKTVHSASPLSAQADAVDRA